MEPTPDCPFELFRDSILVEALKVERIGIITPDNATQSADTFKTVVVGVGPGYTNDSGRETDRTNHRPGPGITWEPEPPWSITRSIGNSPPATARPL